MPQIIDEEYLTSDPMQPDGSQPADVPATCAYFVFVVRLSNLTADILRYEAASIIYAKVAIDSFEKITLFIR